MSCSFAIMTNKSVFQKQWLLEERFSPWLREVPHDPYSFKCLVCSRVLTLSNMGRRALSSHADGSKHIRQVKAQQCTARPMDQFLKKSKEYSEVSDSQIRKGIPKDLNSNDILDIKIPSTSSGMKAFLLNESVTRAEIIWCLQAIITQKSFRQSAKDVQMFSYMFPDSDIATKIQLQNDKIAYSILYGIAPYFRNLLENTLRSCDYIVVMFDESLNKISQKSQMDLKMRFWNSCKREVATRYFSSEFMGNTTATDILNAFIRALEGTVDLKKVLQVSMDGPNVNFKFFRDLQFYAKETYSGDNNMPQMLSIGSCGLHTMHCAFKAAVQCTQWKIINFLRALYNLFKDVPARRATYIRHSKSNLLPLKFCSVRWLENAKVAQRAIDILPNVKLFLDGVKSEKNEPCSNSYKVICHAVNDKLLPAKLAFFITLTADVESFLTWFQDDAPLAPFLHSELSRCLQNILGRVVKPDASVDKLFEDPNFLQQSDHFLHPRAVDVGFGTRSALSKCKNVSEIEVLQFRKECKQALKTFALKLMNRSPLKYKLTKYITCFDPCVAAGLNSENIMTSLLSHLENNNWISGAAADEALREYKHVCANFHSMLLSYKRSESRLDHFWRDLIPQNGPLSKVMRIVLTLSHGNASVERGFSINKEFLVENMREETLIAERVIYDSIIIQGGIKNIEITKSLIHYMKNAHSRYKEALSAKIKKNEMSEVTKKKIDNTLLLKQLQERRRKILEDSQREAQLVDSEIKKLKTL